MIKRKNTILSILSIVACLSFSSVNADESTGMTIQSYKDETKPSIPLTFEEKQTIRTVFEELTERSIEELLANLESIENAKNSLRDIHTLKAFCFIFSDLSLRHNIQTILDTEIKSGFFLMALDLEFHNAKAAGLLDDYISDFVLTLGADQEMMYSYIDQEDFRGLVQYFLQTSPEFFN